LPSPGRANSCSIVRHSPGTSRAAGHQYARAATVRISRSHFTPYLVPAGGPLMTTATKRVLLAGDAGGVVNGAYFAVRRRVLLRSPGLAVRLFLDAQRGVSNPDGIPGRSLTSGPARP
jgi:hypothetical protein